MFSGEEVLKKFIPIMFLVTTIFITGCFNLLDEPALDKPGDI